MTPKHKKRCLKISILTATIGLAVALVLYSLKQNINLYFTPEDIANNKAPENVIIRIGGMVKENSIKKTTAIDINFSVTDFKNTIPISYHGVLPDLFREKQGVVALGHLNKQGIFIAKQILAKHDEKYMPPEVNLALKRVK